MDRQDAIDAVGIATASKATKVGAGTTVLGWVLSSEFGVLVGVVLGVLGLLTNLWFQHRRDKREQLEHEKRMAKLDSRPGDLS